MPRRRGEASRRKGESGWLRADPSRGGCPRRGAAVNSARCSERTGRRFQVLGMSQKQLILWTFEVMVYNVDIVNNADKVDHA